MKKSKLNLLIDGAMFLLMMAIAGLGFLIKYILLPGFRENEIYGNNVDLRLGGFDRHQWGSIHFILAIILLFLLLLHIILHWKMIICMWEKMIRKKNFRILASTSFVLLAIILVASPLLIRPKIIESSSHRQSYGRNEVGLGRNQDQSNINNPGNEIINNSVLTTMPEENYSRGHLQTNNYTVEINGRMTLGQLALEYQIPVSELENCIQVPSGSAQISLGQLRKIYNFHLNELRQYIDSSIHENIHPNR